VAFFVPIIGPLIICGYQIEIITALHRSPGRPYPDFDFNRLGDYLSRGVWKFLVDMMSQFAMMPVYFFLYIVSIFAIIGIGAAFSQNTQNPGPAMGIAAAIIVPIAIMIAMAVHVCLQIVTTPVMLKASLSGDAGSIFDLKFLFDFLRRTWREMLLEMVWLFVTTPVIGIFGLLFFIVGIYPAMALVHMADAHTTWQLYEIYLAKGGEPIRLKMAKPAPVIAVPIDEPEPFAAKVADTGITFESAPNTEPSTSDLSPPDHISTQVTS
jgi:hypothetical protein